jgi:hypothetical protein
MGQHNHFVMMAEDFLHKTTITVVTRPIGKACIKRISRLTATTNNGYSSSRGCEWTAKMRSYKPRTSYDTTPNH